MPDVMTIGIHGGEAARVGKLLQDDLAARGVSAAEVRVLVRPRGRCDVAVYAQETSPDQFVLAFGNSTELRERVAELGAEMCVRVIEATAARGGER